MMKRILLTLLFSLILPWHALAAYNVWLDNSLTKYRQGGEDGTSGPSTLTIGMARNEIESFQVLIYADGETLTGVDVTVGNFTKGADTVDNIYLYRQHYIPCTVKSRVEYELGNWPDALLPKVDRYFNEVRNTFPFSVANGTVQGVWVDVGTVAATVPGAYTATVTISASGKPDVVRTVTLNVWDFELPSTPTFQSKFVVEESFNTLGHGWGQLEGQTGTARSLALQKSYGKALLYHKIGRSFWGGPGMGTTTKIPWNATTKTVTVASWEPWYSIHKDALSGTEIISGPYAGIRTPAISSPVSFMADKAIRSDIANADRANANRQYAQLVFDKFTTEGWEPMRTLYFSVSDEPTCADTTTFRGVSMGLCEAIKLQAQDANAIDTGGLGLFKKTQVNSSKKTGLEDWEEYGFHSQGAYIAACPGWDRDCVSGGVAKPRSLYTQSAEFFLYHACDTNGCSGTGSSAYTGGIDWSVDAPALYNRFSGMVWTRYEATGTQYYAVNSKYYYSGGDPYATQWYYGSNGDGTLFYPGVPNATGRTLPASTLTIGGTTDIPVESIRLKHIRDAVEDFEYAHILENQIGKEAMLTEVNNFFTSYDLKNMYWNLDMNPVNFNTNRAALAQSILDSDPGAVHNRRSFRAGNKHFRVGGYRALIGE